MYQFFVEEQQVRGERIVITGSDVNHIVNVLRMKPGEKVRVSDSAEHAFFCHVEELSQDEVWLHIDEQDELGTEFAHKVYLFQGLPKGDKMELIIQKAVELGVSEIIPVAMKNCVVKLDEKKAVAKVKRWQAIAESAAKQSKRTVIPEVAMPISWKEAVRRAKELDITLVPYENERGMQATREIMQGIPDGASIGVMIGPEGGFEEQEVERIVLQGGKPITLGHRILRTETAGLAIVSILMYHLER